MKTIESRIAPNPKEAQIWVDLSADAHGSVRKYWNGSKWVEQGKSDSDSKLKNIDTEINELKSVLEHICQEYYKTISKLTKQIESLTNRVNDLEQFIVTE